MWLFVRSVMSTSQLNLKQFDEQLDNGAPTSSRFVFVQRARRSNSTEKQIIMLRFNINKQHWRVAKYR